MYSPAVLSILPDENVNKLKKKSFYKVPVMSFSMFIEVTQHPVVPDKPYI